MEPDANNEAQTSMRSRAKLLLEQRRKAGRSGLLVGVPVGAIAALGIQFALSGRAGKPVELRYLAAPVASTAPIASAIPSASPNLSAQATATSSIGAPLLADAIAHASGAPSPTPQTLAGDLPKGVPLPNLSGVMPFNPVLTGAIDGDAQLPIGESAENSLTTLAVNAGEADVDQTVKQIDVLARKYGGKATPFTEVGVGGKPDRHGVIVEVDAPKAAGIEKSIGKDATVKDRFVGGASQRQTKLEEDARARLVALGRQRSKLLEKYLDDAPEVQAIDEQIDAVKKEMRQIRLRKGAAIKVYIGPNE